MAGKIQKPTSVKSGGDLTESITFAISPILKRHLEVVAADEIRGVGQTIRMLIREYVNARAEKKASGK